jgi:uncharacterized membrane protein
VRDYIKAAFYTLLTFAAVAGLLAFLILFPMLFMNIFISACFIGIVVFTYLSILEVVKENRSNRNAWGNSYDDIVKESKRRPKHKFRYDNWRPYHWGDKR